MIPFDQLQAARARLAPHVRRTPVVAGDDGALLKLENLQPTGSYKVRGFFAAALALSPERRAAGLLTLSAGNAAQACAYVARHLGVPCRTVMPDTAPATKVAGVKRWGGVPWQMPRDEMLAWLVKRGYEQETETFIHPFADEEIIAGHGSVGFDLFDEVPDLERVVIAVGGGALICGVASALKVLKPDIEIVGVQSDGYASWPRVFAEGPSAKVVPATIADGTTAPYDARMHARLTRLVDRWVVVAEASLRAAIPRLITMLRVVAEGAGALPYAALEQLPPGPKTVAVVSGGNLARSLLAELLVESEGA